MYLHLMCADILAVQKRELDPLQLEILVAVKQLMWILEATEFT